MTKTPELTDTAEEIQPLVGSLENQINKLRARIMDENNSDAIEHRLDTIELNQLLIQKALMAIYVKVS